MVLAYETLSETHWNAPGIEPAFVPELFTDVTRHMPKKKAALECYASQINHAPSHRLKHQWRLLGSVAARMDATTLKRSRSCESLSKRLLESELKCVKSASEHEICDVHSAISSDLYRRNGVTNSVTRRFTRYSACQNKTKLRCSLLACLDQAKSSGTVGYTDLGPFAAGRASGGGAAGLIGDFRIRVGLRAPTSNLGNHR